MRMSRDLAIRFLFCGATAALTGFLGAASSTSATATTIQPATAAATVPANVLRPGNHQATFEIQQDDQTLKPDPINVYHLRPVPFSLHVTGDLENVAVVSGHSDSLIKALSDEKRPVMFLPGTGCAYSEGNLFINDMAALTPWETFRIAFGSEADEYTKTLKEQLGQLPVLMDSSIQFVSTYAPEGSHDYSFQVATLFQTDGLLFNYANAEDPSPRHPPIQKLDWAKQSELFMIVFLRSPTDDQKSFQKIDWKDIHVKFDKK